MGIDAETETVNFYPTIINPLTVCHSCPYIPSQTVTKSLAFENQALGPESIAVMVSIRR